LIILSIVNPTDQYFSDNLGPTITHSNHATYARDGRVIMDRRSHMVYLVYSLVFLFLFFLAQIPEDYHIEVNIDRICEAITFLDEDGSRIPVPEWVLGPGRRTSQTVEEQTQFRKKVATNWATYLWRQRSVLPVVQVEGALNTEAGFTDAEEFMKNSSAALKCKTVVLFSDISHC